MALSPDFLEKVASVLDAAAAVLDTHEAEKAAAVQQARDNALRGISDRYTAATGESMPDDIRAKLAASPEDALDSVKRLLEKTASGTDVESMGHASEKKAEARPTNKKEAAQAAWDRFGSFINS